MNLKALLLFIFAMPNQPAWDMLVKNWLKPISYETSVKELPAVNDPNMKLLIYTITPGPKLNLETGFLYYAKNYPGDPNGIDTVKMETIICEFLEND